MISTQTLANGRIFTLGEAVKLTGFSAGKFRYNKELLVEAGASISSEGWSIPLESLRSLGWVGVKPPKAPVRDTALSRARERVTELEAEVATLRSELDRSRPIAVRLFGRKH